MRILIVALLLMTGLTGCLDAGEIFGTDPDEADCTQEPVAMTFWLGPDLGLYESFPASAGTTTGNGFDEAFIHDDDAKEWRSNRVWDGFHITGDVTLDVHVRHTGSIPVFVDQGTPDPSQAWQLFTQFGSDRGFAGTHHNQYDDTIQAPGTVSRYTQTFTMPEGGYTIERGDQLRLLMTSLVLARPDQSGSHDILWGGDTPSRIDFTAVCFIDRPWAIVDENVADIELAFHQGLLIGPDELQREGFNFQFVPFTLDAATDRLTISLEQSSRITREVKDDIDITVINAAGEPVWGIGSPYADEVGTFWRPNLDALMPPGDYTVRVDSYSGKQYEGLLTITQEMSLE